MQPRNIDPAETPWWRAFFDRDYLRIAQAMLPPETSHQQAESIWSLLQLQPGMRVLDAPCGYGRIALPLARMGACVLGLDQSPDMIDEARATSGDPAPADLHYLCHDLREPVPEDGFDVALNVFTSFGYGTEQEDQRLFVNLRNALRPGGRLLVETNHRDLMCSYIARGSKSAMRLPDGTLFLDEPRFDPISGVVELHWHWAGPHSHGEKHARWRAYTPTEIVRLLEACGLRLLGAYQGFTGKPFAAEGPEVGGRLGLLLERPE